MRRVERSRRGRQGFDWCEVLEKGVEADCSSVIAAVLQCWSRFAIRFEGFFGVLDDRRRQLDRAGVRHGGIRHSGAVVILLSPGKTVVGLREQ